MISLPGGLYSLFQDLPVSGFEIYISVTDKQPSATYLANLFLPLLSVTPSSEASPTLDLWQIQGFLSEEHCVEGCHMYSRFFQVQLQMDNIFPCMGAFALHDSPVLNLFSRGLQ